MITGCFDDTVVIISTDWSRAGAAATEDLVWLDVWVWLTCAQSFKGNKRVVETKFGCVCAHAGISVHPSACTTSLPLSAQQCSTEPPDYSYFSSNSNPSMPHSPGRSLIRPCRPQPAPSLEWAWWWRSIRLSEGLYIQEADLAQPATGRVFPGKDGSEDGGPEWRTGLTVTLSYNLHLRPRNKNAASRVCLAVLFQICDHTITDSVCWKLLIRSVLYKWIYHNLQLDCNSYILLTSWLLFLLIS